MLIMRALYRENSVESIIHATLPTITPCRSNWGQERKWGKEEIPKKDAKKKMHERKALPKNGRGEAFVMGAKCERKNDESRKLQPTPANDPPVSPSTHPCFSLGLPTDR
ncbi:hypothetical protein NPIL_341151 [Nephila pilipes]|uniref:Uncharacterized protein n=1 Tax=Nephila pilipes TaxID=299642 RepID=A0A8X6UE64_NEPPI|nr:hypothetical protein NPIL_341151 [Nephila pilipes]